MIDYFCAGLQWRIVTIYINERKIIGIKNDIRPG